MILHPVTRIDAIVEPGIHPLDERFAGEIESDWERRRSANPHLFRGSFYLTTSLLLAPGHLQARYRRTSYATFLYWLDNSEVMEGVHHVFSAASVICADERIVMGRMAAHTANAGRIYAPAGSLSDEDVTAGRIDFSRNLLREFHEETGYRLDTASAQTGFTAVVEGRMVALLKRFDLPVASPQFLAELSASSQHDGELDGFFAFAPGEIHADMPEIWRRYQKWRAQARL